MDIFLDDSQCREALMPFSLTRNVAEYRIGILTIKEKWKLILGNQIELLENNNNQNDFINIPSNIIPTKQNYKIIIEAYQKESVLSENEEIKFIHYPWHIFQLNDWAIRKDFEIITENRTSQPISKTNSIIGDETNIFIEDGAIVEHCILNANTGPIYIGKNALIMEGTMIRGPFAILEKSVVKMGAKIYGATTIGNECVVGGEIKNSIFFGFSNKAHDGYLGDSVIGSWCNLGAGTSCSNVKNTGGEVKYKLSKESEFFSAGNKGGLLMADYSRCAINTSFNTGTIVGVCCNIFGSDYPKKYVDHFSWGNERYLFEKALIDIDNWKKMKNKNITEIETQLLKKIFFN
jgi:UDP-N-acetylglucosamine diphosphorylase/glucosamine-1-phosphate N-acetyltransferase